MKFLATIRFDHSDDHVYEFAAGPDEWAIPGGFTYSHLPPEIIVGKTRQAFANGFWSLQSHGHSTFVSVAAIDQATMNALAQGLADHLLAAFGAPDRTAALEAAKAELDFVVDLCRDVDVNTVFTLRRVTDAAGEIREEFRTITPPRSAPYTPALTKVWEIVDDEDVAGQGAAE